MGEKDYISQMVQDTFDEMEANSNLLKFGPKKKSASLEKLSQLEMRLDHYLAAFDQARQCLSLDLNGFSLEIPANWGPFKEIDFTSRNDASLLLVQAHNDADRLLDVFSHVLGEEIRDFSLELKEKELLLFFNRDKKLMAA